MAYLLMGLLVWSIVGSTVAGYFYLQSENYKAQFEDLSDRIDLVQFVDVFVKYGNGTELWHNDTAIPAGSSALKATQIVADVVVEEFDYGLMVQSIDGVSANSTHFWLYWYWDEKFQDWNLPDIGASQYTFHRGDIIAWTYGSEYPHQIPT